MKKTRFFAQQYSELDGWFDLNYTGKPTFPAAEHFLTFFTTDSPGKYRIVSRTIEERVIKEYTHANDNG